MKSIYRALVNPLIRNGIMRTENNLSKSVSGNLKKFPFIREYARELREVKLEVLKNLDFWIDRCMKKLEDSGAEVFYAKDAESARKMVGDIIGTGKIVVKAKSIVSEEIDLRGYLEKLGNEVWETDLGELIIQIDDQKPMHMIVPALHLSERQVIGILKRIEIHGKNAEECTDKVRSFLREKFLNADSGISGCNAFSAESGSIFLIENEGNIRLTTSIPEKHIAIVGIEKILPEDEHAIKSIMVQSAFFGTFPPTYINIIRNRHPGKLSVIFLDNGRKNTTGILKEQLLCVRCGRCHLECPIFQLTGNFWGGQTYGGPMGMGWSAITSGLSSIADKVYLSCLCGKCTTVCPMEINIPKIIRYLRGLVIQNQMAK